MTRLDINGNAVNLELPADTPLLWVLRDELGLTGTKFGCGMALCGACTVHVDGTPTRSCVTLISAAQGKKITTIEAIAATPVGKRVEDAWRRLNVPQCGYCQSGQIMQAAGLLARTPKPTDHDIDEAMAAELEAEWSRVRIPQAEGDEATYGGQNTDGSRSLRHFLQPMREMGTAARQMLETAAARKWGVDVAQVRARNHQVVHTPTGRVLEYGALAVAARELPVPRQEKLELKRPEDFRYIGKDIPIVDLNDMTSGRAG